MKFPTQISHAAYICLLICSNTAYAADLDVTGTITAVTLFQDRAEVTRQATVDLDAGRHTIRFTAVPQTVQAESLRVRGEGSSALTILGVEQRTRFLPNEASEASRILEQKIEQTERELALLGSTNGRIATQRELLKAVSLDSTSPAGDGVVKPRSAAEMTEVLRFVADSSAKLDQSEFDTNNVIKEKQKVLGALKQEFSQHYPSRKNETVIEVALTSEAAGKAKISVDYQVYGPNWRPAYNLDLVTSDTGPKASLATYGVISQSTGEDWKDVQLTLSTARPQQGLYRPEPSPFILDIFQPFQPQAARQEKSLSAVSRAAGAMFDSLSMDEQETDLAPAPAVKAHEAVAAIIQGPVVTYRLPTKVSLASGGETGKVKISDQAITGSILNIAVPAMTSEVYREFKFVSAGTEPLLPGQISVFAEGSFVGNRQLDFTAPNQEVKLPVGLSNVILAKRRLVKKFEEDPGLVRSFRRISTEYEIELQNLSKRGESVVVLEPAPLSRNEKITVRLDTVDPEPMSADNTERVSKDAGVTEWHLALKPEEKKLLTQKATVEFKADVHVAGLENL